MDLKAIILAGGRSRRMGLDKSQLVYHEGMPQELYIARECQSLGLDTFISKAHDFKADRIAEFSVIHDQYQDIGPMGGLLSAMESDREVGWLVLACDMPNVDRTFVQKIIQNRDTSKLASCVLNQRKNSVEPLLCVYEPSIYSVLKEAFKNGAYGLQKILIGESVHMINIGDDQLLKNINQPSDLASLKK